MNEIKGYEDLNRKERYELGEGRGFVRTRRITGYLSTLDSFNDAKRAEERSRLAHAGNRGSKQIVSKRVGQ
jgi:hypothetical protein